MKWTDICVETFEFDAKDDSSPVKTDARTGKLVEVTARRPYGCVVVKVDCDRITIESQDGDGELLEKRELKIDDLVSDGTADELSEELKVLDTVRRTTQEAGMGEQPNPLNNGEKETAPGG